MSRLLFLLVTPLLLLSSLHSPPMRQAAGAKAEGRTTKVGEIMDSKCAVSGSHSEEMRQNATTNARDCTLHCAKNGSYVLYDSSSKLVYQLDDQKKPEPFAGQKVKISGSYDQPSNTISIETIQAN